jgi:hypothetical protein
MAPSRMIRVLAACSLITLLAACGGEAARDREEIQGDRETPSLAEPRDDDEEEDDDD